MPVQALCCEEFVFIAEDTVEIRSDFVYALGKHARGAMRVRRLYQVKKTTAPSSNKLSKWTGEEPQDSGIMKT